MEQVERWANHIANDSSNNWSVLQAELIDAQLSNNIILTKEQVDYIKRKQQSL